MFNLCELPWLPVAPADFRQRCKDFDDSAAGLGTRLIALATQRVDSAQARAFAKLLERVAGRSLEPMAPARIAVLGSGTLDILVDALPVACARHGVAASVVAGEYDQIVQTALDPSATVFTPKPDAIFVQFDHRWLGFERFAVEGGAEEAVERVATVLAGLRRSSAAQIIVTNVAAPPGALFGSLDGAVAGTIRRRVAEFNLALGALAASHGAAVLDVAGLAEQVGTANWFDPVRWHQYKIPFAADCAALYADALARVIAAGRGKARKCLVLDCDNTLWGGVIGDDGIDAIRIGMGDPEGECFLAIQRMALDYKDRGVILAVCSKNDDHVAVAPFREHEGMALSEGDIAVFQANWTDKASNLEAIARTLNIGVDALVFLDDNAAERAQVRAALPLVAVPELPADPAWYPLYLSSAGYFEALSFSDEDGKRAASYAANAQRAKVLETARDLGSYLDALAMTIAIRPFDPPAYARISQLINKSNQFNLTTRRYSEAEVKAFAEDPALITLQTRLADKFTDFGMIGVVIARPAEGVLEVDSWLMSCRVLGRKVEHAMVNALVEAARAGGFATIRAWYLPTAKNGMVANFFDDLGFSRTVEQEDGVRGYTLDVGGFSAFEVPFKD
jgi:FkbH-like protein